MDSPHGRLTGPTTPTGASPVKPLLSPVWEAKFDIKSGKHFYVHHDRKLMRCV